MQQSSYLKVGLVCCEGTRSLVNLSTSEILSPLTKFIYTYLILSAALLCSATPLLCSCLRSINFLSRSRSRSRVAGSYPTYYNGLALISFYPHLKKVEPNYLKTPFGKRCSQKLLDNLIL